MEKLLKAIDELENEYLKVWQDVCNLESPTEYKEGVDRVGTYFAEMAEKRGFKIIKIEDSYQMCSREDYYDQIRAVTQPRRKQGLSMAALETLSIIAYNQPITRSRVEFIRGVDCTGSIARLCERGLIDEVGRMDTPGKPILYGTTDEFLRCFGLESISELPELAEPPKQENFLENSEEQV